MRSPFPNFPPSVQQQGRRATPATLPGFDATLPGPAPGPDIGGVLSIAGMLGQAIMGRHQDTPGAMIGAGMQQVGSRVAMARSQKDIREGRQPATSMAHTAAQMAELTTMMERKQEATFDRIDRIKKYRLDLDKHEVDVKQAKALRDHYTALELLETNKLLLEQNKFEQEQKSFQTPEQIQANAEALARIYAGSRGDNIFDLMQQTEANKELPGGKDTTQDTKPGGPSLWQRWSNFIAAPYDPNKTTGADVLTNPEHRIPRFEIPVNKEAFDKADFDGKTAFVAETLQRLYALKKAAPTKGDLRNLLSGLYGTQATDITLDYWIKRLNLQSGAGTGMLGGDIFQRPLTTPKTQMDLDMLLTHP